LKSAPKDQCTLIRINPDFPLYDDDYHPHVISIKAKGLDALMSIDKHLVEQQAATKPTCT
jgi:hypothetical protein